MAKKRRTPKLSKFAMMMVGRERVCRLATVSADGVPMSVTGCQHAHGHRVCCLRADWGGRIEPIAQQDDVVGSGCSVGQHAGHDGRSTADRICDHDVLWAIAVRGSGQQHLAAADCELRGR